MGGHRRGEGGDAPGSRHRHAVRAGGRMDPAVSLAQLGRGGRDRRGERQRLRRSGAYRRGVRRELRERRRGVPAAHAGAGPSARRRQDHRRAPRRRRGRGRPRHQRGGSLGGDAGEERRSRAAASRGARAGRGLGGARRSPPAAHSGVGSDRGGLHASDGGGEMAVRPRLSQALLRRRSQQLQGNLRQRLRDGRLRALVQAHPVARRLPAASRLRRTL